MGGESLCVCSGNEDSRIVVDVVGLLMVFLCWLGFMIYLGEKSIRLEIDFLIVSAVFLFLPFIFLFRVAA